MNAYHSLCKRIIENVTIFLKISFAFSSITKAQTEYFTHWLNLSEHFNLCNHIDGAAPEMIIEEITVLGLSLNPEKETEYLMLQSIREVKYTES